MQRFKILIVAHEFSPDQGSECAVGWNIVLNLCRYHDITVIYARTNQFASSNYEDSVNKYIREHGQIEGLNLIPVSQPRTTRFYVFVNSLIRFRSSAIGFAPLYYAGYKAWQKAAFMCARNLLGKKDFDVVHQLTSISFREPGYLWKLGVPFIWGPCSGLVKMPSSFYKDLSFSELTLELIRRFSNYFQSNFSIRVRKAMKKAALIYPVSTDDLSYFQSGTKSHIRQMLDVGTYAREDTELTISVNGPLKLIWVGRLVYTKALYILLRAISRDVHLIEKTHLTIVGDGPLMKNYKKIADELKLKNVTWLGSLPHESVFKLLKESDVLVHTSIKEATSAVLLESLTQGCPVICHDAFGMSYAIDDTCGIKVPLKSPNMSILGFGEAIKNLESDRTFLNKLKQGSLRKASVLSWQAKAKTIANDYTDIILKKTDASFTDK